MMRVANILDEIHDRLDPSVFDAPESPAPKFKSQHREWVLDTVINILEAHGYKGADRWLGLFLTGSLCTYQYSDRSDCDVSLFVDTDVFPEWSRAELIAIMVENIDGTPLPGTTHPMQCYVVPSQLRPNDLYKPGIRSGYDLIKEAWIVPPEHERSHDVAGEFNGWYQYALEQADKMDRLLRYEPETAVKFWHQLHRRRMDDMRSGKGDYSLSNIVYKFLDKRGLFDSISQASGEYIAKVWLPGEDDTHEYSLGQCAAFAAAHQREYPHLRFGLDWERVDRDHPSYDWEDAYDQGHDESNAPDQWRVQHIFTHDDHHAYDVEGKHPLPYQNWDKVEYNQSYDDVSATGMLEPGYMPDRQWIQDKAPKVYATKTAGMIPHPDRIEEGRQRMGLQHPVRFIPTFKSGLRGGYAGMTRDPRTGQNSHTIYFNPQQHSGARNWSAWHEMAHAYQTERDGEHQPTTGQDRWEYAENPREKEAEQLAMQHADHDFWGHPQIQSHTKDDQCTEDEFLTQVQHVEQSSSTPLSSMWTSDSYTKSTRESAESAEEQLSSSQ